MVQTRLRGGVTATLLCALLAIGMTAHPAHAQQLDISTEIEINDLDLEGVAYDAATGVLTATGGTVAGTIAGMPFTTDITDFDLQLVQNGPAAGCSILNLALAPIDIDLLGLHVDTSAICLNITAIPGGGVLGDLLCSVAGGRLQLLNALLRQLEGVVGGVLNGALDSAGPPAATAADICDGNCEILDLAVGPVDLTLLGLNVHLDNCANGPVQVCLSATEGAGLLGDLLCGLAGGGLLPDLGDLIGSIIDDLGLDLGNQQINQLVRQVNRALDDGSISTQELRQLTRTITRLLR